LANCSAPEVSKDLSLHEYVVSLRQFHPETFTKLDAMKVREKAKSLGCKGSVPDSAPECVFCKVKKHQGKWKTRRGFKGAVRLCGAYCYACSKAAELLGPTRSMNLIDEAGARHLVLAVSAKKRQKMGAKDVCACARCKPKKGSA